MTDLTQYPGAPADSVMLTTGPFQLTLTGMTLLREATFEEWHATMGFVQAVDGVSQFWLGDLINYGERAFGDKYTQALHATPYAVQTLRNAAYVAKAITPDRRKPLDIVSYGHHAEVASLPPDEQTQWLDKVESDHLTREQLRVQMKAVKAVSDGKPAECWMLVKCEGPEDYEKLADRLRAEGRVIKAK